MTTTTKKAPEAAAKNYAAAEWKSLDRSRVEITGSVAPEVWEKYRPAALKNLNNAVTIDGFRKGNVPENILLAKVGEMALLEEMAELSLPRAYADILIDQKIDAIGRPEIQVTKLAKGNPMEFKAITAVVPKLDLPDYQALAAKTNKKKPSLADKIEAKELDEAILRLRKMHASHEGHDHAKMTPEEHEKVIMANLPELNDEFVRKLGDFADVAAFKTKLTEMLLEDKRQAAKEKHRLALAEALTSAVKNELPDIMIESELARTESQFRNDIERMGIKLDDYLKHLKKTIEDIRQEWRPEAEKKAKLQLILDDIAKAEKLRADAQAVEAEVEHIVSHYADADRERATVYAETVLTNEKVFEWLEKQA